MHYEELVKYRQSHNLWWMCNSCSDMLVKQRNNRHALVKNDNPKTSETEVNETARINDEIVAMKKQITTIYQSLVI